MHPKARLDAQRDRIGGLVVRLAAASRRAHEAAAVATDALAARLARELGRPMPQAQRLHCAFGRDAVVTRERNLQSAAQRSAVDGGDDRFRRKLNLVIKITPQRRRLGTAEFGDIRAR